MSQNQTENPNLQKVLEALEKTKKELQTSFETRISALEKTHTTVEPPKPEGKPDKHAEVNVDSSEPTSSVIVGHLRNCPECYEKVGKEAYGVSLDSECVGCGKFVNENAEKCPFCGGTHARKRAK